MVDYRCYLLDGVGAIRGVATVVGADDESALLAARRLLAARPEYEGFDLWQEGRRVHVMESRALS